MLQVQAAVVAWRAAAADIQHGWVLRARAPPLERPGQGGTPPRAGSAAPASLYRRGPAAAIQHGWVLRSGPPQLERQGQVGIVRSGGGARLDSFQPARIRRRQ